MLTKTRNLPQRVGARIVKRRRHWISTWEIWMQPKTLLLPAPDTLAEALVLGRQRDLPQLLLVRPKTLGAFRPVVQRNGRWYTTTTSIKTRVFTLRIRLEEQRVILQDHTFSCAQPELFTFGGESGPIVLPPEEMRAFIAKNSLQVTHT